MTEQHTTGQLAGWITEFIADHLDIPAGEIARDLPLECLGVDSATTLVLATDLTALVRREVRPAEIFENPTIEALAAHLTGQAAGEAVAA